MKREGNSSAEALRSLAGRRAVAGAVGASLSLPLAASAFAAPVCACGGGGSDDQGTSPSPAAEEPPASTSQSDLPAPPPHEPSPPVEPPRPVVREPEPAAPEPSPQLERLMREEQRYSSSPAPAPSREEADPPATSPEPAEEPAPARPKPTVTEPSAPSPAPSPDAADPPAAPSEPVEEPAPARPQRYGVDSYLYAHLPPEDQAAIRDGYERRTQPQPAEPTAPERPAPAPTPSPDAADPPAAASEPVEEPAPVRPQPTAPEPSAPAPAPSPDAADPPAAPSEPVEEPAPARPQRYGVDSYLYAHLPPEDQAAIRDGYERGTQPAEPTAPERPAPSPAPSPDAADPPARPQRYGVDASLYAHLPPEDQAAIREGSEARRRPSSAEAGGCTPVQGPYLNEADRPCVVPDRPSVPVSQIGTQPEPPASSEPAVTGVGSGGGGGGGGSWGGEEEDIVEDKPWWEDGLSAVGGAVSWTGDQTVGVGKGLVEGVQGIGEGAVMLYRLSPTNAVIDNESWREEWSSVGDAAQFAVENPGEFGQALINWEDLEEGRYGEWLGNLGPDVAIAVATAGTGTAATVTTRTVRSADAVADVADAARDLDRAADAADAARDADRAADAGRAAAVDVAANQRWLDDLPTKPTPDRTPADRFEIEQTGPVNYRLTGGGESVWADGFRVSDGTALEAKHVGNPQRSPYVDGSTLPEPVRAAIQADLENELQRYGAVIRSDPHVRQLEIITNEPTAVPKFEDLMRRLGVPGQVRLVDD